jgi:hypothetical protein
MARISLGHLNMDSSAPVGPTYAAVIVTVPAYIAHTDLNSIMYFFDINCRIPILSNAAIPHRIFFLSEIKLVGSSANSYNCPS